jgi:divalent metal cation (Fe/Co/Zn/Cd) transporter
VWGFVVMGLSIVIDLSRSSALSRVAKKYDSQALEADALHFSTDIWSSSVVILGLILVRLSPVLKLPWLAEADAVTAMGVAAIVVYISIQLGRRTIAELLDAVPPGTQEQVAKAVAAVPGVLKVEQVRIRKSGPDGFADINATVDRAVAFVHAHDIANQIERAVRKVMRGADTVQAPLLDVVVHLDPVAADHEGMVTTVRLAATRHGLGAHGIRIYDSPAGRGLELHLEVPDTLRLDEAHAQADEFEQELRGALPEIKHIVTHIEPAGDASAMRHATLQDEVRVMQAIQDLPAQIGVRCDPHEVTVHRVGNEMSVSFHCDLDPRSTIADAHRLTDQLEHALRARVPNLNRVVIHVEPAHT